MLSAALLLLSSSTGLLGWLGSINKVDDSALHTMVGMDHYVLLRHCLLGFNITFM